MSENTDYSERTLEDLQKEEKKIVNEGITAAVIVGFLIGVMLYGLVKSGFGFIYTAIPLFIIYSINRYSKKRKGELKQIQAAIKAKNTTS